MGKSKFGENMVSKKINEKQNLTTFEVNGAVSGQDLIKVVEDLYSENPTEYVLFDFSRASKLNISHDEIKQIVLHIKNFGNIRKKGKTALVAPDDLSFGISRIFQTFSETYETSIENKVFRRKDESLIWLGIKDSQTTHSLI